MAKRYYYHIISIASCPHRKNIRLLTKFTIPTNVYCICIYFIVAKLTPRNLFINHYKYYMYHSDIDKYLTRKHKEFTIHPYLVHI